MKGTTGFLIGAGVGYVMGVKASKTSRDRVEEALARAGELANEQPTVAKIVDKTIDLTEKPRNATKALVSDQLRNASEMMKSKLEAKKAASSEAEPTE